MVREGILGALRRSHNSGYSNSPRRNRIKRRILTHLSARKEGRIVLEKRKIPDSFFDEAIRLMREINEARNLNPDYKRTKIPDSFWKEAIRLMREINEDHRSERKGRRGILAHPLS